MSVLHLECDNINLINAVLMYTWINSGILQVIMLLYNYCKLYKRIL